MRLPSRLSCSLLLSSCVLFSFTQPTSAQPTVAEISQRGLQIGGTTSVRFQGAGFDASTQLLLPHGIPRQEIVGDVKPGEVELSVTLDKDVAPGITSAWLVSRSGATERFYLGIDQLQPGLMQQGVSSKPIALTGNLRGNQVQQVPVPVKAGERLVIDVQAKRLGSALNPILRLYGSDGRQIAASRAQLPLAGDTRLEWVAKADEVLTVEIQDMLLRGANPGHFRLLIGDLATATHGWPLGGVVDSSAKLPAITVHAIPENAEGELGTAPIVQGWYPVQVRGVSNYVGQQPQHFASFGSEFTEADLKDAAPEDLKLPVGVSGMIDQPGERDRLRIPVPAGKKLRITVWAERLGSTIDPSLVARIPGGKELGRGDDSASSKDPSIEVTVPADQTELEIVVWDLLGGSGKESFYRVSIQDADQPSLNVGLEQAMILVPSDGGAILSVPVNRARFAGDVQLRLGQNLPGVTVTGGRVPAQSDRGILRLQATPEATARVTQLLASADQESVRVAAASRTVDKLDAWYPWQQRQLLVVPVQASGIAVESFGLTDDATLWQGGIARAEAKIARSESAQGPVRIKVVTTQQMPRKKIKKDNKDVEVDAVERALRLDEATTMAAGKTDVEVPIAVPVDLKPGAWGLVLVAERLTDDKTKVLSTSVGEVVFPVVKKALSIEVGGGRKIESILGEAASGKFVGEIKRHNGFEGPVVVTITGLPDTMIPPEVELDATQSAFELEVAIQESFKPEQLQNVRLLVQAWDEDGYKIAESTTQKVNIVLNEKPAQEDAQSEDGAAK